MLTFDTDLTQIFCICFSHSSFFINTFSITALIFQPNVCSYVCLTNFQNLYYKQLFSSRFFHHVSISKVLANSASQNTCEFRL